MKKKYFYLASVITALLIVFFSMPNALTFSSQAPPGNTGSPGDGANNTCAKSGCHVGTVNSGSGNVSIDASDIPATGWLQGKTYKIKVVVAEDFVTNYGFQLATEDPNNNNNIGTLGTGGNSKVVVSFTNWISHNGVSSTGDWTFDWTAPTGSAEEVEFYATGNAANGNGNNSGDHIYKTNINVKRDMNPTGISSVELNTAFRILQNPVSDILKLESTSGILFALYTLNGEMVKTFYSTSDRTEINVSDLSGGMYIISNIKEHKSERIIIQ